LLSWQYLINNQLCGILLVISLNIITCSMELDKKRICFLVNVDWFYISHRKALADVFVQNDFIVSVIAGKSKVNKLLNRIVENL